MPKKQKTALIVLALLIIGISLFYFQKNNDFSLTNPENKECIQKATEFFERMNTNGNQQLDYSFAKDDSALTKMLGENYPYIVKKDSNCYAVVKNYNPQINEYRYSILNIDIEEFEVVLLDHDLQKSTSTSYQTDFILKYNQLFK